MNKKRIRHIIICAIVLIAAVVAAINIDIEVPSQTDSVQKVSQNEKTLDSQTDKKEIEPLQKEVESPAKEIEPSKEEEPVSDDKKDTSSEKEPVLEEEKHVCTVEIRCDTVTDTSKLENEAVIPYVPSDGVILKTTQVEYTVGESVFDVLLRITKEKNIHLEFRSDGVYGGEYIEGINYLYEMDAGPLSGWMYKVNGQFPNYGCSNYNVKDGDAIVWIYTCDLGLDVGDNSQW